MRCDLGLTFRVEIQQRAEENVCHKQSVALLVKHENRKLLKNKNMPNTLANKERTIPTMTSHVLHFTDAISMKQPFLFYTQTSTKLMKT